MFKIESYITPIIINYIDKYVKDFRPQNAQVSLWGGEVAFQHLDIRLDVLQQELHLPLNIVSGHIHELTVRVPWTKIASEPIQINVNTIEFVVKLKSDGECEKSGKEAELTPAPSIVQEPPGYMASLINKIAHNISIKLNNIIFKYIEEDIVLSMNIQTLSIDSANDEWQPAFIDINSTKVTLKKVIDVHDLTVCLDRPNAQGKIDVCQEPILYRCSLQARMIRKYNLQTAHFASMTRIDVFTDNIDFKISVQQIPMLIRLYLLIQMLRDMHTNRYAKRKRHKTDAMSSVSGRTGTDSGADNSYSTWIWNMLPAIFPPDEDDERIDAHEHIYHNGFYAKNVSFVLKSQEIVTSSIIQSTTAFKYHPILKVSLSGLSFDAVSIGRKWYNLKGGIAYIGIFPLGSCTCGQKHNLPTIFLSGRKIRGDNDSFLMESMKDPNCCENKNQNRVYDTDFHTHLLLNTEEEMLDRSPALAWDIVGHKQASEDGGGGGQSMSSYDGDTTSTEEYFVRAIFGSFNLKIDTSLTHLWQTLTEQYDQYTYTAPYLIAEKADSLAQLVPPSTEDYESLLDCIPLRKTNLYLNKSLIEFYNLDADHSQSNDTNDFHNLPFTLITLRRAEINQTSPLYPDKLVHTTCQLPDPTELLKEHCYFKTSAVINEMRTDVVYGKQQFNVLSLANAEMSHAVLIKPEFWLLTPMKMRTIHFVAAEAKLTFNKPQLILLQRMVEHFNASDQVAARRHIKNFNFVDLTETTLPVLEIFLRKLQTSVIFVENTIGASLELASICGYCSVQESERFPKNSTIFISNEDITANLLSCCVQYPINMANAKYSPTLCLNLGKVIVNCDRIIQRFLNYRLLIDHGVEHSTRAEEKMPKRVRKTSKMSKPLMRSESVHSNSVTTLSLVNSTHKIKERDKSHLINWHAIIKRLIVYVDLKSVTVLCPNDSISLLTDNSTASSLLDLYKNSSGILMTIFRLPSIEIQTSKFKNIQHVIGKSQFPIQITDTDSPPSTGFPWTIELNELTCSNLLNRNETVFLPPVHTKLTLDLLSSKPKESDAQPDDMSFVIHLDTTPITLNLCTTQVKQIFQSVNTLATFNRVPEKKLPMQLLDASTSFYDAQINDFIGETTTSEKSSEEVVPESDKSSPKVNFLIQWTITKFTLSLIDSHDKPEIELALELEDIISSVDKQSTYTKVKTKFGSLNGIRKRRDRCTGAINLLNIIGKSETLIEEAQETFFEMISTTAMANNVHNRWGANTRKALGFRDGTETITELMVTMQSIDVKVELDVLNVIFTINDEIARAHIDIASDQEQMVLNVTCVKDLPLIFFDCKGVQMWIPHLAEGLPGVSDVLIVKINALTIAPSVENPIQRKPVREDIYTKAAQLRMINTPGALIEDRQYELLLKNISLVTGNWNEILSFAQPQNNENPAFDWNNQIQKPSLNVNTLFNDFVVSIVFAPAIVFQNIIVCGQALEVNCINDLAIDITLNDLAFLNDLCQKIATILSRRSLDAPMSTQMGPNDKKQSVSKCVRQNSCQKLISSHDQFDSDSGFKSNLYNERTKPNVKVANALRTEMPHSFSFVGGLFTVRMFQNTPSDDIGASVPLISVRLDQPNLLILKDTTECDQHISLFNLSVRLFDETIFAKTSQAFGDIVLDTHRGELDESGVAPSLFELKQISQRTNAGTKIVCEMRKPLQLRFAPKSIQKLLSLKDTIAAIFKGEENLQQDAHLQPIVRYNKISEIKKLFGNATTVDFHMSKFIVDLMSSTNSLLSMCLYKLDSKVSVQDYPEQLTFNANLSSLAVNTDCSMVLHPTTLDFDLVLTQEKWNRRLLVAANLVANIIDLQISPADIQTLAKIQVEFMACMQQRNGEVDETDEKTLERPLFDRDNLIQVILPQAINRSAHAEDQFFQDDLRLGTFEYITVSGDSSLPLPYQIFLSNGPNEMQICWRYPHPRTINFVQIYPIPGHSSIHIKCRLEYLHESHNTFFPYVLFEIGNRKRSDISLPKRRIAASVWRIVLLDPLASLRDLELELDDNDIVFDDILNPKTIIGCIRIDTIFSVRNIPIVQANLRVNRLSLAILNNVCILKHQVPDLLQQYSLKVEEHVRNTQEFCAVNFSEVNASVALHTDMEWKMYNEFAIDMNVFDSSYLTMIPLIDRVPIKCYFENNTIDQPNIACVTVGKLRIHYGPSIGFAIAIAEQIWQNILRDVESKNRLPILTRFVICNSTSAPIKFGQNQTDEQIWLQQNECFYYAFRAINLPQKLKFAVRLENNIVDVGDAFVVDDRENINYFGVGDGKYLLIFSRKVSTTQRQILVKGQIEVLNMTKETFQIHYKTKADKTDAEEVTVNNQCGILLAPSANGSILEACNDSREAFVRLQLAGGDANGWSGEIPLNRPASTIPWIVKVPTKSSQKFITYTVRIHSEYIEYLSPGPQNRRPKRLLIVIWPLFTARSLIPTHLTAIDTEHVKQYLLVGKGACRDLQVAGTFDTEHNFMFPLPNEQSWSTILTYKTIDKKAFFAIPEHYKSIDAILKELSRVDELKWPCSNEEELLIERRHTAAISTPPIFKFSASRDLSCSMQLDVIPWALFINALRFEMKIVDANNIEHCAIPPNQIVVPSRIENAFQIHLKIDSKWYASQSVHLYESRLSKSIKHYSALHLPENGSMVFEMNVADAKVVKLHVSSSVENSTRIVTVAPFFVICNYSAYSLNFTAFCMHRSDKRDFKSIANLLQSNQLPSNSIPDNSKDASDSFKGCECSTFYNLSPKQLLKPSNTDDFNYFLAVGVNGRIQSAPILISKPINRTAFGICDDNRSIPFAASVTEHHQHQHHVSIYEDIFPFIEIDNRTNIDIFVAEADFADFSKSLKPKKSIHDENFPWLCTVKAFSCLNYTPPSINERFAEKQNQNVHLIFGCENYNQPMPDVQWSIPIETNKSDEKYLALPFYGDIKMTSSIANKTVTFLLQHIDFKKEFNVKVVHTKLSSPNTNAGNTTNDNLILKSPPPTSRTDFSYASTRPTPSPLNSLNVDVYIEEVTFTMYDEEKNALHKKNDIVSLFLDDVLIAYAEERRTLEFGFSNIQIDNRLFSTGKYDFPVILCGQNAKNVVATSKSGNGIGNNDIICDTKCDILLPTPFSLHLMKAQLFENQLAYIRISMEASVMCPKDVLCSVKPLSVYVEDKFISSLLDFVIENLPSNIIYMSNASNASAKRIVCETGEILVPRVVTQQILSFLSEPLRLEHICIKPLSILLSVHTCMRMYIALDHSPLQFAQFESRNVYTTTMRFGYNIGMHYVSDAIFGAGWVVGSLEILGSPSGLARSVSNGLWDFVSMPVQGLMRGPWGVLLGITYGSASLVKNITAGTVNSVTKLAASVARNLDRLTLDDEHLERTEALRRTRPLGITQGLTQGLTGFGINLLGAVGGIARHALEANNTVGVFTGLGKGLIGVVTKPISGAAELVALAGQGVLQSVGYNTLPMQRSIQNRIETGYSSMTPTKVMWKFLSKINYMDRVLVAVNGTLVDSSDKSQLITFAVTTELIVLIALDSNELIKVLTIPSTRVMAGTKTNSVLYLNGKSDDESQQYHHKRILQYLSKAYDQMNENRATTEDESQQIASNEPNKIAIVFDDANKAQYLSKYIHFLNFCLSSNK